MQLLTKQMKEQISNTYPLYSQDGKGKEAICITKFFIANWTWYILEGNFEKDDFMMYGIVINGISNEYGYVSLNEMESVNVHGFEIERDRYFENGNIHHAIHHDLGLSITIFSLPDTAFRR